MLDMIVELDCNHSNSNEPVVQTWFREDVAHISMFRASSVEIVDKCGRMANRRR